jgi:hypothetical protein
VIALPLARSSGAIRSEGAVAEVEVEPESAERRWTDRRLFTRSPLWKSGGVRGQGGSVVQQVVGEGGAVLLAWCGWLSGRASWK